MAEAARTQTTRTGATPASATTRRTKRSTTASDASVGAPVAPPSVPTEKVSGSGTVGSESNTATESAKGDRPSSVVDRRVGFDRRDVDGSTNLERRRGPGRRRTDFTRTAEEGEMNQEQFLFLMAIDAFKQVNGKTFPSWTDVLEVIRKLGYRKTMASELELGPAASDWVERPDAPSGVDKEASASDEEDE